MSSNLLSQEDDNLPLFYDSQEDGNSSVYFTTEDILLMPNFTDQEIKALQLPPEYSEISRSSWPGIIAYGVVFVIASAGNLLEFYAVLKRIRTRFTPMNMLLMNMCVADILVAIFVAAVETIWRISIGWYGGSLSCKWLQFCRAYVLYLSSFVLICLSLDRYYAVLYPLRVVNASRRVKVLLIISWITAGICAAPQLWVFDVRHHPRYPSFTQCTSVDARLESFNTILSAAMMYFIPLVVIIYSYTNIIWKLTRENDVHVGSSAERLRRSDKTLMDRAKLRALKLSFIILVVFLACWTPYEIIVIWHILDRTGAEKLNPFIQEALFIMVVANSCANPLVYGVFHSNERKSTRASQGNSATLTMCTYTSTRRPKPVDTFPTASLAVASRPSIRSQGRGNAPSGCCAHNEMSALIVSPKPTSNKPFSTAEDV